MNLALVESIIRWAGAAFALITLGVIFYGVFRGASRPVGSQVGRAPGVLHSIPFYIASSIVFFGVGYLLWRPLPLSLSPAARWIALVVGSLLYFTGLGLTLWGRLALGRMYFVSTGMGAQLFADHRLVTGGPFAIVRHPMYTGITVAILGGLLLYQTWTLVAFLIMPFAFVRRARQEGAALAHQFGADWQAYCRRVPACLPRLRPRVDRLKGGSP